MINCIHTWEAYRSKKNSEVKPNWCTTCGKVKTKEDERSTSTADQRIITNKVEATIS